MGGRRGWIPSLGYSGKEGVTFLFVHITEWQPRWRLDVGAVTEGRVGSVAPLITFTAAGAGLGCVGGRGQEKHHVPSSDVPESGLLRADSVVDPLWIPRWGDQALGWETAQKNKLKIINALRIKG